MKRGAFISACVLLMFWPHNAAAQEPATTKKQDLIRELLVVTEARNLGTKIVDAMVNGMSEQYPQTFERLADSVPSLTPAQRRKLKDNIGESQARFLRLLHERLKQRIDLGQVIEGISTSLYDKYFTEGEISDLVAFYKTPTGKKTLSVLPQMLAESIQQSSEKLSPILIQVVGELMEEEKARMKQVK